MFSLVSHSGAALQETMSTREVSLLKFSVKFSLPRWEQASTQEQTEARMGDVMFLPDRIGGCNVLFSHINVF